MTTNLRFRAFAGFTVAATLAGAFLILNHPESEASEQSTDDAYVQADFTVIVSQVAGTIIRVDVADHQEVRAGAPLASIDDRDLRIAADNAKAHIASAQATIDGLQAQIARQLSTIEQARAAVAATGANLKLAEANRSRFANLARDGSGTVQAQQQAEAQWDIQRAARERDLAGLHSAEQQTAILRADLEKARANLLSAQAEKATADLNLSYARVTAPVSGVVAQRSARVGGYARVGQPLLTLVPLDAVYVEANFRETQLARVRAGQPVTITVDALPNIRLQGRVESLGPASGISFSTTPPHNATGNFTKIVQRLPVRIRLEPGQEAARQLRVGMSVRPRIDVSAGRPEIARAGRDAAGNAASATPRPPRT
ncbi:HlyD family secretion protein (plasmid) [Ralstonia syzygii subsp. celebesensis]|uniref:Efflux transporter periplasmic adaptor subunit n=2 Tax=Ralstonia syzygii subsp. celebesensis TaxID=1310168 RepID=A0A1U9VMD4_9RALS|nr:MULTISPECIES: HlyD family secretion protein [Ralstonia solanacearum species complex]AQW31655.1 efflux transporter periplasmic adaptor subunit [blood disease bacterium A2-HR MARDI]CBJ35107.1 putative multidrug resistance homolog transmembrane protein (emrA) [Ralstonia solanacearum PSI07]CCA83858.1 putative multidrug resistance homolog transmembrane protein (emrA) [blood disease bacterium R229]